MGRSLRAAAMAVGGGKSLSLSRVFEAQTALGLSRLARQLGPVSLATTIDVPFLALLTRDHLTDRVLSSMLAGQARRLLTANLTPGCDKLIYNSQRSQTGATHREIDAGNIATLL